MKKQNHKQPYANNYLSTFSYKCIKLFRNQSYNGIHFIISMSRANALEYKSIFHKTVFLKIQWTALQVE